MNRNKGRFGNLAQLQGLAALECRRDVEQACAETDRKESAVHDLVSGLDRAEQDFAALHSGGRVCLSRLRISAAVMIDSEDSLRDGRAALVASQSKEDEASGAWLQARYRTDWLADCDRYERRKEAARRADRADTEARTLRILTERAS